MAAINSPNLGRKADKQVRDALLAALRQDPEKLKKASEKVWQMAIDGDLAAFKEIADRLDGKVAQAIIGGDEGDAPIKTSLTIEFIGGNTTPE